MWVATAAVFAVSKGCWLSSARSASATLRCPNWLKRAGLGAAMNGMRPIVEIMTVNFSLLALDQIMNTARHYLHMSGGQFNVPVVIRMATGAGRQLGAQHAHSLEGWYTHIPGIRVLAPATVEDARGMLWPALEDPDPVIIFEHQILYNIEGHLPSNGRHADIDYAKVRRTAPMSPSSPMALACSSPWRRPRPWLQKASRPK